MNLSKEKQIIEQLYEFENRIAYLEDKVQEIIEIIEQYSQLFNHLSGLSTFS